MSARSILSSLARRQPAIAVLAQQSIPREQCRLFRTSAMALTAQQQQQSVANDAEKVTRKFVDQVRKNRNLYKREPTRFIQIDSLPMTATSEDIRKLAREALPDGDKAIQELLFVRDDYFEFDGRCLLEMKTAEDAQRVIEYGNRYHSLVNMVTWNEITIPETPSPNFVIVKNISLQSSEKTVKEFFLFCGKIKDFELQTDDDGTHQVALINFERESAAKTAVLLSNALIDDSHIAATPYFETASSNDETTGETETATSQETKAKSRIAAEILANGYLLQDHIVAKGLEYDHKYSLTSRFNSYLSTLQNNVKSFDDKYRIWDKAMEYNQKYKIQEKVTNVAQVAQSKAEAALQTPTGQKVNVLAHQTLAQIAAVHYEAKRIQSEKLVSQMNRNGTAAPAEPAATTTTTTTSTTNVEPATVEPAA